jgi:hypothetical protein
VLDNITPQKRRSTGGRGASAKAKPDRRPRKR